MKFVITSGGTAGHINPSLALAEELTSRNHQVVFAGTPNRLESKLVPDAGYDFKSFEAFGFNRKKPWTLISSILSISKSTRLSKKWLKDQNADAVIGFGSYVSLSVCRAAKKLGIPYAIHEQNSVMGMANKYLCKNANAVCLTYKHADPGTSKNVHITGNPVRKSVFDAKKADGRKMLGIDKDKFVLLVFGGSLGANKLNNQILKMTDHLLENKNLHIVHITGEKQYAEIVGNVNLDADKNVRYSIFPYQNKMGEVFAASNACICRAGASTIAELTARALPALLIPYPFATENHQFYNSQALLDAGCAMYLNDNQVETDEFKKAVKKMIDDKEMLEEMHENYKQFDVKNSASRIADIIETM